MVIEISEIEVYNSFDDMSRMVYSKEAIERAKAPPSVLAKGDSKSLMFQQRYYMILQQLFRDSKFVDTARGKRGADFPVISFGTDVQKSDEPVVNSASLLSVHAIEESASWKFDVTPVESLPGSIGVKIVFGMLTKGDDGKLYVEDIHQTVPIKIDGVLASNDFITENMFVLIKGEIVDEVFVVTEMTLPPVPQRSLCESSVNLFGGPSEVTEEIVLSTIGGAPEDSSIAVLANVLLEDPRTIEQLHLLFSGFEECDAIPNAFVLMGDFISKPFNSSSGESLRTFQRSFDGLSQLLARHPVTLERSKIILVPGPSDPTRGVYPQAPLSDALVRGLASRFPSVILSTNPCRIRFYNRQILLFSGDIVQPLRRSRMVASKQTDMAEEQESEMVIRSVLSQMHLCPGPARDQAVIWDFDAGMRLYPPPSALFLSDTRLGSSQTDFHGETVVVGMPKFVSTFESSGEFHLYSPQSNESTISSVSS